MHSQNLDWRQGSLLTPDSSIELGLCEKNANDRYVIIISHDCDLASEKETHIEVIVGRKVEKPDSRCAHARNVRCLQITYEKTDSSQETCIELTHSQRKLIKKELFVQKANLDLSLGLSPNEKIILKQWLAARYGRPAFPNSFENRLRKDKNLEKKLSKILTPANSHIDGVFFDLGEDRSTELSPEVPYLLRISLVYYSIGGPVARSVAEHCAINIKHLFHKIYGPPANANELILDSCHAVADTIFSLADLRKVDRWRLDYISLREKPT